MAKFASDYTFRDPLRTIEFKAGGQTLDAEVIAAAQAAGVLEIKQEDSSDGDNGTAKGSAKGRTVNLKG